MNRTDLPIRMLSALAGLALFAAACSDEQPVAPTDEKATDVVRDVAGDPPVDQATIIVDGAPVVFWPYTGTSFDGTPVDPINVVFVGADPLQVRAALTALDGDRSAFGIPPVPPFDDTWHDAVGGDVQTTCAVSGCGWTGSVVQLTLGDYGPLRVHLRLFGTGQAVDGRAVTLGGAHFELQIPGTTSHEVLSWEMAEQIVAADMMRTGLLDAAAPAMPTGLINAAPSFRAIDPMIYNLLPPELVALIGGPAQPVSDPVPLDSDGQGTLLNVAAAPALVPGKWDQDLTVEFDQLIPRPFCAEGPGDFLLVTGPVDFSLRTHLAGDGAFTTHSSYSGVLEALPIDMSGGSPVPVGEPFTARVSGLTDGRINSAGAAIKSYDRRFTHESDGTQLLQEWLNVPHTGVQVHRTRLLCIDDE
jgi:hypothetical protein